MCRTRKKRLKKKVEQEMYTKQSERRYRECRERAEAEENTIKQRKAKIDKSKSQADKVQGRRDKGPNIYLDV